MLRSQSSQIQQVFLKTTFSAFPSLWGIVINDLSMKVVKDYWPPKTWVRACTLECFFSLVNYFLPALVGD
jgi:hypothetical protein